MLKNGNNSSGSESPRSKGARISGGKGGDDGNTAGNSNTITCDKSELSFLLDTKFETAAKRSESHIDIN